jgi:membrane protein DedA with SNARE-associated domain
VQIGRRDAMIGGLANMVLGTLAGAGYPGIAVMVGLESVGLPLPGETTLLAASYLASTGQLSLPLVIGAAAVGAGGFCDLATGRATGSLVLSLLRREDDSQSLLMSNAS